MKRTFHILSLAAALAIGLALAGGQASAASGKKMSSPDAATFVRKAAVGGMTEIKLSELAKQKTSDASVRQFADRMVTDHTEANAKLRTIAQGDNLTMPTSLDSRE
ncbi:MAG: DUF4142 domain-containing protein, partial [Rhodanobacteraceae bacterium]